ILQRAACGHPPGPLCARWWGRCWMSFARSRRLMATDRIPVGVVGGQGHPLMRVLAGSPTNYEGTIPANIRTFIHTVGGIIGWGALRGIEGLRRYDRVDYTSHMRAWIEMTPLVRRWIHSDR